MQADFDRLDGLIGQILTLTRLQTRGDRKNETIVNLRLILESVGEDASFEGKKDGKSVAVSHLGDCWVRGDPSLLRSCIENVVRNAVYYTKPQSQVVVSLSRISEGGLFMARILVSDRGDGVPEEALPRLFEPFYRITEAQEHQTGGTGLGLSIAQRIVLSHGGSIAATNRDDGGLEINILLPTTGPI
jgi:two-component system sensor histidine kinase CpxA